MVQKFSTVFAAIAIAFILHLKPVYSGIMAVGVPQQTYLDFAKESQFDSIGSFTTGASGTLIASNWVLSAGHVGGTVGVTGFQIRGTGTVYTVAEVIQHPTFLTNGGDINFGFDIELVRLATEVIGVAPASIYRGSSEVGNTAALTGFGVGGFGDTGDTLGGAQRAGENTFDAIVDFADTVGKTGAKNSMLITDFDSGSAADNTLSGISTSGTTFPGRLVTGNPSSAVPLSREYHLAGGDSGGGVFLLEGGQWYLAGVNSGVESQKEFLNDPLLKGDLFKYSAISFVTRVSSFQNFIDSNITAVPEPSSLALVGLIGAVAAYRRLLLRKSK